MNKIEAYLAEWDPIGLIEAGAPSDEYSLEASELARRYKTGMSGPQVASMVHGTLVELTGVDYEELADDCRKRAQEIQELLNNNFKTKNSRAGDAELVAGQDLISLLRDIRGRFEIKSDLIMLKMIEGKPVTLAELTDLKIDLASLKYNDRVSDVDLSTAIKWVSSLLAQGLALE